MWSWPRLFGCSSIPSSVVTRISRNNPLVFFSSSTTPDKRKEFIYKSTAPPTSLSEDAPITLLFDAAKKRSHLTGIECGITGRKYTYGEIVDGSLRWATTLSRLGRGNELTGKPTVGVFCKNCPEYAMMILGAQAVGCIATTISYTYTDAEVSRQLMDAEVDVLVVDEESEAIAERAVLSAKRDIKIVVNGRSKAGHPNFMELITDSQIAFSNPVQTQLRDISLLLYSSGTTGKPKGVAISNGAVSNHLFAYSHPHFYPLRTPTSSFQDNVIGIMPMYHVYGLVLSVFTSIYNGVKIISLPGFHPDTFVKTIREHKVGVLHLVPTILNFLINSPKVTSADLISVRGALCGGAPVSATVAQALKEKAPNPVFFQEGYGMTETLICTSANVNVECIGSCGELIPNVECKLLDISSGESLPPGRPGEICIRSPTMMSHYHNNPTATSETIDTEGWLHTGDVAVVSEDGYFTIVDRIKELIKVKGLQVAPSEVEDVLLQHPGVADAGVVGVPDERAGELPRAYVILRKETTAEELHQWMSSRLAAHKQLKGGIHFVNELPKNATGKLLRRKLKEIAASGK